MATKKDMRRDDLIIPYSNEPEKEETSTSANLAQTMPMAAMFLRNKMVGWTAVVFSIQNWLSESPAQKAGGSPGYVSVGLSLVSLAVVYLPLFMPPQTARSTATQAQAPAPVPPA